MEGYNYQNEITDIFDAARINLSDILPSEFAEKHRMMTGDITAVPGPFRYENSPYTKEIVDCISPSHPARIVAFMKGGQSGVSTSVIENGIGYIMSQAPGNILFLVGHEELVKDAMKKVDRMIDNTGLRHLIKSTSQRARNTKSGDTDRMKEFPGGYLKLGPTNHKWLRNMSMMYGFVDDFEAMKGDTDQSGSTTKMVEQRFAAFAKKMKLFYISTPERKETSNIEPVYLMGDQRKYHVPCPCCGVYIILEWDCKSKYEKNERAGMTWKTDDKGSLIPDSVGYVCQECGGFFDDKEKTILVRMGKWVPTAEPSRPGYYSYQISNLYAPTYMFGWEHYVREFLEANPINGKRNEHKWKAFKNLVLGETYENVGESISANVLQQNIREYEVGSIPEKLSKADGNGKIVLITCACDLNGKEDDCRLDYEIVAFSESGVTYSVNHGSVGTFILGDKGRTDREYWTYKKGHPRSVWPDFEKVLGTTYKTDTGRSMRIMITGVDTGHFTTLAYDFVDNTNFFVLSLKGKDEDKYVNLEIDLKTFRQSKNKGNLYLVESNTTKDLLAEQMKLNWDPRYHEVQPAGFMNFPTPSGGKYLFKDYFAHFEAEHKVLDKDTKFRWVKKSTAHQNHMYDCRLYAIVIKDILLMKIFQEEKIKNGVWQDYVDFLFGGKK